MFNTKRVHKHHKKPTATTTSTTTPTPTPTTSTTTTATGSGGGSSIGGCNGCSWNGDFSTGNFLQYDSFLSGNIDGNPADFTLVQNGPTPPSPFQHAFNATLQSGSGSVKSGQAGERTLTTLWPTNNPAQGRSRAYNGATSWYRDEQYFPSSYQPSKDTDFNWTFELHNAPDSAGDDMVSCGVDTSTGTTPGPFEDGGGALSPARYSCRIFGGGNASYPFDNDNSSNWYTNPAVDWTDLIGLKSITPNTWYDMVWQIGWSCAPAGSPSTGFVNWWINGKRVGSYVGPTLLWVTTGQGGVTTDGCNQAYLQTGYYRPDDAEAGYAQPTESVDHAGTMIGPTAASIGENLP